MGMMQEEMEVGSVCWSVVESDSLDQLVCLSAVVGPLETWPWDTWPLETWPLALWASTGSLTSSSVEETG